MFNENREMGIKKREKGHSSGKCDNGECSNWINKTVKGTELGGS